MTACCHRRGDPPRRHAACAHRRCSSRSAGSDRGAGSRTPGSGSRARTSAFPRA